MKKKQLLQAIKSLPMLAEDKEKFVNIILNNSGGGSQDDIRYYLFENIPNFGDSQGLLNQALYLVIEETRYGDKVRILCSSAYHIYTDNIPDSAGSNVVAIALNFNIPFGSIMEDNGEVVIFNNIFEMLNFLGLSELIDTINAAPTITKEEFYNLLKQ